MEIVEGSSTPSRLTHFVAGEPPRVLELVRREDESRASSPALSKPSMSELGNGQGWDEW